MTTLRPTKSIVLETIIATAVLLAGVAVTNPFALGLGLLHPHPVWLVVLVVAARYGARGLIVAVPITWGVLAIVAAVWLSSTDASTATSWHAPWHGTPARLLATLATPSELGALAAAVLVGWVASAHERHERASVDKVGVLERRAGVDGVAIEELRRAALALRARNDRLDFSLTFLRGVAERLEGSDPTAAAEAALELATARLGARAAAVLLVEPPETLVAFAVTGIWNLAGGTVSGDSDGTVIAALRSRTGTRAMDLPTGSPGDSDLAAPIIDARGGGDGVLGGVLAVRGVPRGGVSVAALRDLAVIADWSAGALARAKSERGASKAKAEIRETRAKLVKDSDV